jgi:ATP-dependent Clp endopeptidase proteolytic subunit ClpP
MSKSFNAEEKPFVFNTVYNKKEDTLTIEIEGMIGFDWMADSWSEAKRNTAKIIKKKLAEIANTDTSKIIVNINSLGGDVNEAISIHDVISEHKAEVTTNVYGMTASSATIIAQSASKENRRISSNALFLIHHAWGCLCGNAIELRSAADEFEKVDTRIFDIYKKRSGDAKKSEEDLKALFDANRGNGTWITADDAKEYGLIDQVFEPNAKAIAAMSNKEDVLNSFKQFAKIPDVPEDLINKIKNIQEQKTTSEEKDTNLKNNKMKIKNTWAAIVAFFGFTSKDDKIVDKEGNEPEINDEMIEKLNAELESRQTKISNLEKEKSDLEKSKNDFEEENKTLKNEKKTLEEKVKDLEASPGAEPAKAKKPTETTKVEEKEEDEHLVSDDKSFMENVNAVSELM